MHAPESASSALSCHYFPFRRFGHLHSLVSLRDLLMPRRTRRSHPKSGTQALSNENEGALDSSNNMGKTIGRIQAIPRGELSDTM